jgi:hypothetical protein
MSNANYSTDQGFDFCLTASRSILNQAIANLSPHTKHLAPIYVGMRDHRLLQSMILRGAKLRSIPKRYKRCPHVFVIGDDLLDAKGPKAFHKGSLLRVFNGAGLIFLHCAKAQPEHYEEAVAAAIKTGRSVIIESQPTHEKEWLAFVLKYAPMTKFRFCTPNAVHYPPQAGRA